jgi:hypothetical protein
MLSSLRPHIERVASGRNEHVENDDPYAAKAPPLTRHELEVSKRKMYKKEDRFSAKSK